MDGDVVPSIDRKKPRRVIVPGQISLQTLTPPLCASTRALTAALYGAVCHCLFAIGVGSMIVMMFFGMSRAYGTLSLPWAYVANLMLLLQFPIAHSFLLGAGGRKILKLLAPTAIGAELATTTYAAIASAQVALLFLAWSPSGVVWWQAEGFSLVLVVLLYLISWLLLLKAIFDAGFAQQVGLLGWWAVFRNKRVRYPPMPSRGLFRLSRQPIYLAFALTLWTVPTWTPDQLALAIGLSAYCLFRPSFKRAPFPSTFR